MGKLLLCDFQKRGWLQARPKSIQEARVTGGDMGNVVMDAIANLLILIDIARVPHQKKMQAACSCLYDVLDLLRFIVGDCRVLDTSNSTTIDY